MSLGDIGLNVQGRLDSDRQKQLVKNAISLFDRGIAFFALSLLSVVLYTFDN